MAELQKQFGYGLHSKEERQLSIAPPFKAEKHGMVDSGFSPKPYLVVKSVQQKTPIFLHNLPLPSEKGSKRKLSCPFATPRSTLYAIDFSPTFLRNLNRIFMNRNEFVKTSVILGGSSILPTNNVFSQSLQQTGMDKLTDKDGKFALQPLPYGENFLEPAMDQETLHLHYTFHHGDAAKAANKDLEMIKKAIDENSVETVDYWTKKLSFHLSSHILHTIFWTNLTNKKSDPSGDLLKQIEKDFGSYDKAETTDK
jgi:hypothetical protein